MDSNIGYFSFGNAHCTGKFGGCFFESCSCIFQLLKCGFGLIFKQRFDFLRCGFFLSNKLFLCKQLLALFFYKIIRLLL